MASIADRMAWSPTDVVWSHEEDKASIPGSLPTSPGKVLGQPGGSSTVGNSDVGNAFCATGQGGGIDPSCSPKTASKPDQGLATLPTTPKAAGKAMADALAHIKPEVAADPELRAKVAKNWARELKGKVISSGSDFNVLQDGIKENLSNKDFAEIVAKHGPQAVVLLSGEGLNRRAESVGASVLVYSHSIEPIERSSGLPPRPGASTSEEGGGIAAVLRHEYAHRVYDNHLSTAEQEHWNTEVRRLYTDPADVKKELTVYAGTHAGRSASREEVFTEAFAVGTSPHYDPSLFSERARNLIDLTLTTAKGGKTPVSHAFDPSQTLDDLDTNAKAALTGGRWVTIEGRHVYLKGGKIVAGPPDLKGETLASAQVKVSSQTKEGTGKGESEPKGKPDRATSTKPAASKARTTTEPATAPDKEHATPNRGLPDQARPTLHEHEARAIKGYTIYAKELNASLRSGDKLSEMDSKIHEGLTSAFGRAKDFKEPVNVYRGMRLPASDQGAFLKRITEAHAKGEEITIPGYMSTSTSQKEAKAFATAYNFPTRVVLEVKAKRGLDLQSFSYVPEQKEFLLDHNSKFTVGSVKKRGELTYVTLEHK